MRKIGIFIPVALLPLFCHGLVSCAYGQSLVFGPEFFSGEGGQSRRVVKSFSVQDVNRKFVVSVQGGMGGEGGVTGGAIDINGERIASPDDFGRRFKMLKKPVNLQKQNDISVEVSGGTDAPVIVTVMGLEEHTVAAKVPPIGEAVDLVGYASAIFPAGTFGSDQDVTITATDSPLTQNIFEADATGPRLPYEIRINTGNKAPEKDVEVSVNIPDSFFSSDYQIHIFARMHGDPDGAGAHDRFYMVNSGLDEIIKTVMATLPKQVFSNRHGKNGTYEAIITVGLIR